MIMTSSFSPLAISNSISHDESDDISNIPSTNIVDDEDKPGFYSSKSVMTGLYQQKGV